MSANIIGTLVVGDERFSTTIYSPVRDINKVGRSIRSGLVRWYEEEEVGHLVIEEQSIEGKKEWRLFIA